MVSRYFWVYFLKLLMYDRLLQLYALIKTFRIFICPAVSIWIDIYTQVCIVNEVSNIILSTYSLRQVFQFIPLFRWRIMVAKKKCAPRKKNRLKRKKISGIYIFIFKFHLMDVYESIKYDFLYKIIIIYFRTYILFLHNAMT